MATTLGQMPSSISLPPISEINNNFDYGQHGHGHAAPHELSQQSIPPPARTLPPLPYYSPMQAMPQPEYVQPARPMYAGVPTPYGMPMARMPLPSSSDAAHLIGYAPSRHNPKTKEVKRRTKTGCMTCRKRRIKCGEERPQCRNCIKSKRQCAGYDPVFQAQPSHSIQPASSLSTPTVTSSQPPPSRSAYNPDPTSPTSSSHNNSGTTSSPREHPDYGYHRPSDLPPRPILNQGYRMGAAYGSSHANSRYS